MTGSEADLEAYLRACAEEAERLVEQHLHAIEALANALLDRLTRTGEEARAVIGVV